MEGAGPHRVVQRRAQNADHGGMDTRHRPLDAIAQTQAFPLRQGTGHQQERRYEDGGQQSELTKSAPCRRWHDSTQKIRKAEQGPRHSLRGAMAWQEGIVAPQPTGTTLA